MDARASKLARASGDMRRYASARASASHWLRSIARRKRVRAPPGVSSVGSVAHPAQRVARTAATATRVVPFIAAELSRPLLPGPSGAAIDARGRRPDNPADPAMAPSDDDPALGLLTALGDDGSLLPTLEASPPPATLLAMDREMRRIRRIDDRMMRKQRQGAIGFYGAVTGQEAVPIATGFATEARDWIFPALRESAIMLVRGFPLPTYLAQVYGNEADILRGRQMPSHMSGRAVNQVSWSSCLGPQLPQAVGAAMAARRRGDDVVTVGFTGDGATSEGDFHAAMNFAGVFRPPCVLVCQNNQWAISVPASRQTASETFAVKARAYGLPGVRVDGNDVLAVHRVLREAVARARGGKGPTFVEAVTYRLGAHSSSDDPRLYRTAEEEDVWRARDPILRLERHLRREGLLDDARIAEITAGIDAEIDAALARVEGLPPPPRVSLFEDVLREPPWHLREQRDELSSLSPGLDES